MGRVDDRHAGEAHRAADQVPAIRPRAFDRPEPDQRGDEIDAGIGGIGAAGELGLAWYGVSTEYWTATAVLLGDTLPVIELAAGECVAGAVQIDLPEGATTAYVLYVEPGSGEIARWAVG